MILALPTDARTAMERVYDRGFVDGRQAERTEILSDLERLWSSMGGKERDGVTAAIQRIRKRNPADQDRSA